MYLCTARNDSDFSSRIQLLRNQSTSTSSSSAFVLPNKNEDDSQSTVSAVEDGFVNTKSSSTDDDTSRSKSSHVRLKRPNRLKDPYFGSRSLLDNKQSSNNNDKNHNSQETPRSLGEQLLAAGERVAQSSWIQIDNIPPMSSLQSMLAGLEEALKIQYDGRGILDLDAEWSVNAESLPLLELQIDEDIRKLVKKAVVVLSPYGRPTGWKIQFTNRSIVQALLLQHAEKPIVCAWKPIAIKEFETAEQDTTSLVNPQVTDATLRVEGFPHTSSPLLLMNLFSRFDLDETRERGPSIQPWKQQTVDGKSSSTTWLVHFADPSWARAALRERQAAEFKGNTLVLAPYPEQIL